MTSDRRMRLRHASCWCKDASPGRRRTGQLMVPKYRLAWCSVQWRMGLSEACRTGRRLVASRSCVNSLKRCDECHEHCDNHRYSEKYDGGTVAIPLFIHEESPLNAETFWAWDGSSRS